MSEKLANSATHLHVFGPTGRLGPLVALTSVAMLVIWCIDQSTITNLIKAWKHPTRDFHARKINNSHPSQIISNFSGESRQEDSPNTSPRFQFPSPLSSSSSSSSPSSIAAESPTETTHQSPSPHSFTSLHSPPPGLLKEDNFSIFGLQQAQKTQNSEWVTVELEQNYSANLMVRWLEPGGEHCKDTKTVGIRIPQFDGRDLITLSTGESHEIVFQALDGNGNPRCLGGDYFEVDLSGDRWRSRPPLKDMGNGNYSFTLQVHQDFPGQYNLTIILLFRHLEGLKFSPTRFGFDKQLRRLPITFTRSDSTLPELQTCRGSDLNRTLWAGRWTRHARNDRCEISDDGRYRCQPPEFPCPAHWCNGPLGLLESDGWVYSAHCGFKLFTGEEAWDCLNNKWLFWWGDSNHVDTVRNLLFFILGVPDLDVVTRRLDKRFTNPRNQSQTVRITNIFNGHWDDKGNYEGLNSLSNLEYREMIKGYFNGSRVPDTVIFNSGLHDGVKWASLRSFIGGAEFAASFWARVMSPARADRLEGRKKTQFVFRSTITTGGYARTLAFNPNKIEAFNGVLLDKLRGKGLVDAIIDDFDITWAWHYDNRCNDGVHYGRFPAKLKWRDGQIGHQYFVDLMLGHVLLNAICSR